MRVSPTLVALSLSLCLLGASAPAPEACRLELVVAESAHPKVHDASRSLASRLSTHGVSVTTTVVAGVPAADLLVDLTRLTPSWWRSRDTVRVFTRPSPRDDELGRVDHRAGEVHLNAAHVPEELFPTALWEDVLAHELGHLAGLHHEDGGVMATELPLEALRLTDDDVAQVAAAWC